MKLRVWILSVFLLILALFSCEMDSFLFNAQKIDRYRLPGNDISEDLIEQVTLDSEGFTLYGYWVNSNGERPGLTILYCHGNKHNIDEYWDRVMLLHRMGVNIFIFDYRGFGRSEGQSSEKSLMKDGESALSYVLSRNAAEDSLCLYGYSLGNFVSIYLAAKHISPLCLVSEAPFASANSLTQSSLGLDLPPRWLTEGEYDNVENIRHIDTPFLLLHGAEDDFVRYRDNGKVVYDNAPHPKSQIVLAGATHSNIPDKMKSEYQKVIMDWIEQAILWNGPNNRQP